MTTQPPSQAILVRTFASRERGGLAYARPIAFRKKWKALFKFSGAVQLHNVLLLARKQFHLDHKQVYLKGHQSIFENVTGQLVVFSTKVSLGCVAQPRLFLS